MPTEFDAFVAIGWADKNHAWTLQKAGSPEQETGTIDHTHEAVRPTHN
jgi:hypothetical protein